MKRFAFIILLFTFILHGTKAQEIIGNYHSEAFNRDFKIEIDTKHAEYEGKDTIHAQKRIYLEVYSLDYDKVAFIEMNKQQALDFVSMLKYRGRTFIGWRNNGEQSGYKSYFKIVPDRYKANIYFEQFDKTMDADMIGKADYQEYYIEYFYNRRKKEARMFLRGGKTNDLRQGSNYQLSGWSMILLNPDKEVEDLQNLIKKAIEKL